MTNFAEPSKKFDIDLSAVLLNYVCTKCFWSKRSQVRILSPTPIKKQIDRKIVISFLLISLKIRQFIKDQFGFLSAKIASKLYPIKNENSNIKLKNLSSS